MPLFPARKRKTTDPPRIFPRRVRIFTESIPALPAGTLRGEGSGGGHQTMAET